MLCHWWGMVCLKKNTHAMARNKAPLFGLGGDLPAVVPLFRVSRNTTVRKACAEHSLLS